jgi:hypothetical protein
MSSGARGASTSSIDAVDVASDNHLDALAGQMFDRVHAYVHANVEATVDEYRLLQNMNDATRQRYDDMRQVPTWGEGLIGFSASVVVTRHGNSYRVTGTSLHAFYHMISRLLTPWPIDCMASTRNSKR